jgi:hypothetical protein
MFICVSYRYEEPLHERLSCMFTGTGPAKESVVRAAAGITTPVPQTFHQIPYFFAWHPHNVSGLGWRVKGEG